MELVSIGRVLLAFAFVLALMLGLAWAVKRLGLEKRLQKMGRGKSSGNMEVEETLYLDPRHRLVIVRRGKKRYVLLLGQQQDMLVECYEEDGKE